MKKSFLPSFAKGLIAFSFCAAVVAMTACSESSSSGGGATAPDNPANPITPADTATNNTNTPEKVYLFGDIEKVADLYVAPVIKEFYGSDLVWNGSLNSIESEFEQRFDDIVEFSTLLETKLRDKGFSNVNVDAQASNYIDVNAYILYNGLSFSVNVNVFGLGGYGDEQKNTRVTIKVLKL